MSVLTYEKKDRIAFITVNRPDVMNALNVAVFEAMAEAWYDFKNDPEAWTAILSGAGGRAFSAGADLMATSRRNTADQEIDRADAPKARFPA